MTKRNALHFVVLGLTPLLFPIGCGLVEASDDHVDDPFVAEADYPAAFGETLCGVARSCGCEDVPDNCDDLRETYVAPAALAQAAGLSWDGVCAGKRLAAWHDRYASCAVVSEPKRTCCKAYVGTLAKGQACSELGNDAYWLDACAQGLRCSTAGSCEDMCPPVGGDGDECQQGLCLPGTSCDYDVGPRGTCRKDPEPRNVGEACAQDRPCSDGLYCSLEDDTCHVSGNLGSSCAHYANDCIDGLSCGVDDTCVVAKQPGDACTSTLECDCMDGVCGPLELDVCINLSGITP